MIKVLKNNEINAFTFPDRHLVVNSNLILNSDYQEELLGVICHEIAHIELNHVMNKLIKEIGLSVLISMSTGNVGTEVLKETVKILSSTAFDRNTEKEADMKAVDYLLKANLNPEYFAGFLKRLSVKEKQESKYLVWISTHPDSEERAKYISTSIKNKKYRYKQVLSIDKWFKLKEDLRK
jgi:predicted Zn-dependent protease